MSSVLLNSGAIFDITAARSVQSGSLAGASLSNGIDAYVAKDYEGAVKAFRRSIGQDPYSSNSLKAYDFMAQAYLQLDREIDAESTYKQAIRLSPNSDDLHLKLANLYYNQKRYAEAEKEYSEAVRVNPSEQNIYSLGQLYLSTNRLSEAEAHFNRLLTMNSANYGALYSLGQIDIKQGKYDEAIAKFKQTIEIKKDFAFAYSDLGMAYADIGQEEKAEEQAQIVDSMDTGLASDLRNYIYQVKKPGIFFATTLADPVLSNGPGTLVSSWDAALTAPNGAADFTLTVYFDKPMDRASVESLANWKIGRSNSAEQGGLYNWGLPIAHTEITLAALPRNVLYDADNMSAKVMFTVNQNADATGSIDPSHIRFGFYGKDAYGNTMNTKKDEYLGLSIIV